MKKIELDQIRPEFNPNNWRITGSYKIEYVNGYMYTSMPRDHPLFGLPEITQGMYIHEGKLTRVIGSYPEFVVYTFV